MNHLDIDWKSPLVLSASAINSYDSCFTKFVYSRLYSAKDEHLPEPIVRGLFVHDRLAGEDPEIPEHWGEKQIKKAELAQTRIEAIRTGLGLTVLKTELSQTFAVNDNVHLTRRVDALCLDKRGEPVLIDYKIVGWPWKVITFDTGDIRCPQAEGWQSTVYLMPPPRSMIEELGIEEWPKRIHYLIYSYKKGTIQNFPAHYNKNQQMMLLAHMDEIYTAVDTMKFTYPRIGYGCNWCFFNNICFAQGKIDDYYDVRDDHAVFTYDAKQDGLSE